VATSDVLGAALGLSPILVLLCQDDEGGEGDAVTAWPGRRAAAAAETSASHAEALIAGQM
jgi:hypothetical protein